METSRFGGDSMLEIIAVILLLLWVLGVMTSYTFGGLINLLFVFAVVAMVFNFFQER
ncbi:lmo0937 family membrane protein [Neisseriaceae bacterium JH1-16]|nr:lmo0937 family membrane protein [Neisseriaceae bacterium JH1-16]